MDVGHCMVLLLSAESRVKWMLLRILWVPVNGFRAWKRIWARSWEQILAELNCTQRFCQRQ